MDHATIGNERFNPRDFFNVLPVRRQN
jgi:hypothetical protein